MSETWTVLSLLNWAAPYLEKHNSTSPRLDAELLLAKVLDCRRLDLYLRFDKPLAQTELQNFKELILSRRQGVPVAYLLGHKEFWSLEFIVNKAVLVPRPETEHLIEAALEFIEKNLPTGGPILDIGTGCGNIILTLAHSLTELADFSGMGVDIRPQALEVARENARNLALETVTWQTSDLFQALNPATDKFDLIVSNPPYVDAQDMASLPDEYRHEPELALASGDDGLDFTRRLLRDAPDKLSEHGVLIVEVGNSWEAMVNQWPQVPFFWFEFERGGHGVFMLTRQQLLEYREQFSS